MINISNTINLSVNNKKVSKIFCDGKKIWDKYKEVESCNIEYIAQYFEFDFVPSNESGFDFKFQVTNSSAYLEMPMVVDYSNGGMPFGLYITAREGAYLLCNNKDGKNVSTPTKTYVSGFMRTGFGVGFKNSLVLNHLKYNIDNDGAIVLNDVNKGTILQSVEWKCCRKVAIFRKNTALNSLAGVDFYNLKLYEKGELKLDIVPILINNHCQLLDKVNNKIYVNQNSAKYPITKYKEF